ncbi:MAG: ChaB family protein [Halothece sp.]
MANEYRAEQTVSGVIKEEKKLDKVVRRLLDQGIPQDHISVLGKNFQSQTRISGFVSKKDIILGGLRTGGLFGSLFGSVLALLTGIGALWIPFVGWVVAGGPIGAALLGAAGGAIAGGAGAGLASFLSTLGMPEDKATLYQTRLEAGEFLIMAEVPANQSSEIQSLLENEGAEEVHTSQMTLPRPCPGRCESPEDLSPEVRGHLSEDAQQTFIQRYNTVFENTQDPMKAEQAAWQTIREQYDEDENGIWSKQKVTA